MLTCPFSALRPPFDANDHVQKGLSQNPLREDAEPSKKFPHAFLLFFVTNRVPSRLAPASPKKRCCHLKGNRLSAGLVLLENLLDDLLLLDQEGADNAVLDAVGAARTTVGALNGLLGARDGGVLAGTESGNLKNQD